MVKQLLVVTGLVLMANLSMAQDAATLYQTGKSFLIKGDYENAILVLRRAVALEADNMTYSMDLITAYMAKGDIESAKKLMAPLLDKPNADETVYYTAFNIAAMEDDRKAAEKHLKKGLKKFDKSGILYNAYGEFLAQKNDGEEAIKNWENGIKYDPNYAPNYANAAKYYYYSKKATDKIWAIYYGEMFINLESYTRRTAEMKNLVLESYKQLILALDETTSKQPFEKKVLELLKENKEVVGTGVTTNNLVMLRTRFILFWFNNESFPSSLYARQQALLKEGLFEMYNYWLFESVNNLESFNNYVKLKDKDYDNFNKYMRNRVLKVGNTEYYKN